MTLPLIAIGSIGGTVSMQAQAAHSGVRPTLSVEELLLTVPQLAGVARFRAETIQLLPSASLDFSILLDVLKWAKTQVASGADGVVILQGTDTLEESSFFLDLLWDSEKPLVLTGAMRNASQPGADGPANLWTAALVALDRESRHRGVLVAFNDQVHEAKRIRKNNTLSVAAFESPIFGACGALIEDAIRYHRPPVARLTFPAPARVTGKVALIEATLSADTDLIEHVGNAGYDGLVIGAFGAGHVSVQWADALAAVARKMPVVVSSRTGAGPTAEKTYGYKGGEIDLAANGMVMAGFLCPRKSRILLTLVLGAGATSVREVFQKLNAAQC